MIKTLRRVSHTSCFITGPLCGDFSQDPGECWQSILWSYERDPGEESLGWHAGKVGERKEEKEEVSNSLNPMSQLKPKSITFSLQIESSDAVILNNYYLIKNSATRWKVICRLMTQSSILNIIFIFWEKFFSALISTVMMTAKSLIESVSALSLVLFHSYLPYYQSM